MTRAILLPLTALWLGALHAVGPDHLAAVSVYASRRPSWRRGLALGVRWGLGHSLTIALLGGAVALAGVRLPERFTPVAERAVGVVLVVLGAAALVRVLRLHAHWHEHDGRGHWHVHAHGRAATPEMAAGALPHGHEHRGLLGIGMLHGLAGTGVLLAVLPAAVSGSRVDGLIFLVAFGCGTVLSMALLSAAAGHALHAATRASPAWQRAAAGAAAAASIAVGLWWISPGGA